MAMSTSKHGKDPAIANGLCWLHVHVIVHVR